MTVRMDVCVCICDMTLNFRATTGNKLQQDVHEFYKTMSSSIHDGRGAKFACGQLLHLVDTGTLIIALVNAKNSSTNWDHGDLQLHLQ